MINAVLFASCSAIWLLKISSLLKLYFYTADEFWQKTQMFVLMSLYVVYAFVEINYKVD